MDDKAFALFEKLYTEMLGVRSEIQGLRTEMTGEIQGLRTEMTGEIQGLRTEMTGEIQGLRTEMTGEIQGLRTKMATKADLARMEYDTAQKFGALFDGLSANTEAVQELKGEIKALKKEVENHEIKLKLVK